MTDDPAVQAARKALDEALLDRYALTHDEMVRAAVEAARPIIEAEMARRVVSLAYGQTPDWCVENIDDDMRVSVGDLRAVAEGRYYPEDGYYVKLPQ